MVLERRLRLFKSIGREKNKTSNILVWGDGGNRKGGVFPKKSPGKTRPIHREELTVKG